MSVPPPTAAPGEPPEPKAPSTADGPRDVRRRVARETSAASLPALVIPVTFAPPAAAAAAPLQPRAATRADFGAALPKAAKSPPRRRA